MSPLGVIGAAMVMRNAYEESRQNCGPAAKVPYCIGWCKHVAEKRGKQWYLVQLARAWCQPGLYPLWYMFPGVSP